MPETLQEATLEIRPLDEASEARRLADAPFLGRAALLTTDSVRSFYGADTHYLGRALGDDKIRSIIKKTDGTTEVVAEGDGVQDSLSRTLEAMHTLETVDTKPIVRFTVDNARVSLTELKHYAPRVAPTLEAYPIPAHLGEVVKGNEWGMATYKKTAELDGWQQDLFAQLTEYVSQDEKISELAEELKVTSLSSLTPEQAVKLSLGVVQLLSKYTMLKEGDGYVPGGAREDKMTTMDLLEEGRVRSDDPEWEGNGVCRNVASNVKAVFDALKANQTDLSMLRNTYAVYESGTTGYGDRKRTDASKHEFRPSGHAWNTFVTVGKNGESSITTVDATWSMGRNSDGSLRESDFTSERMFETIAEISEKTEDKTDVALAMSDYLDKFSRLTPGENPAYREQKLRFALTEWLKIAPVLLKADMPSVPRGVTGSAYRLGAQLDKSELKTLFDVQQAGWINNFDAILGSYTSGKTYLHPTDRLVVQDGELQNEIFEKLGAEKTLAFADSDIDFRVRVRETTPGFLPEFNPENNPADKRELASLLRGAGLFVFGDKYFGDVVRNGLVKAANGDQSRVEAEVGTISDYDILRNYQALRSKIMQPR